MSQPPPPPPPNQPPPGEFGAPQDPPPGGFGAPQDPSAGGFGAPQAPPPGGFGAPQPPQGPGYGYPGQQPAQPPGPPGPPYGYGYPQQPPTYPMQPQVPQGGGGGRKPNGQVVIIVAAVAAVALIIGGGVWYSSSSGKDDGKNNSSGTSGGTGGKGGTGGGKTTGSTGKEKVPANTGSKVLFQVPAPAVPAETSVSTVGSWLTDKVYAKSGNAEINGYDPDSGAKVWTIKLPGPVCAASPHASDSGRTAIVYEPAMPTKAKPSHGCSEVSALDLAAGKLLWTKSVKSGDQKISLNNVTTSANTVAVGSTSGGAAFDISTGKALWAPKPTDSCYDAGYGGGDKLVAVRKCGEYGRDRRAHV